MTSRHQPSEELQAVGRRVGVVPQPMPDSGAFELRFELAGRQVVWSEEGAFHVVTWVTPDCAIGIMVLDSDDTMADFPLIARLPSGLSVHAQAVPWTNALEAETRAWLKDAEHLARIERLPLVPQEFATFGWPQCIVCIRPQGAIDVDRVTAAIEASDAMVDPGSTWLAELRAKMREPVRWSRLPKTLRHMARFSRRWGEGDDGIRADRMDRASSAELLDLYVSVAPHFLEIDAYEADTVDPPAAFQRLTVIAEAAAEARGELDRRGVPLPSTPSVALVEEVHAALAAFDRALANGDAEALTASFAVDARLMLLYVETLEGRAAIRDHWNRVFDDCDTSAWRTEWLFVDVHGDRAYAASTYAETLVARGGTAQVDVTGRLVLFLRRELNGRWLVTLAMNSNDRPPERRGSEAARTEGEAGA